MPGSKLKNRIMPARSRGPIALGWLRLDPVLMRRCSTLAKLDRHRSQLAAGLDNSQQNRQITRLELAICPDQHIKLHKRAMIKHSTRFKILLPLFAVSLCAACSDQIPEDITAGNPAPTKQQSAMVECLEKKHQWIYTDGGSQGFCSPPPQTNTARGN
jgi:hypothetical protein